MNADEFVYRARTYGFYQIHRVKPKHGLYHIEAKNDSADVLTWFGESRDEDGHISKNMTTLVNESMYVQRVVDEIRAE